MNLKQKIYHLMDRYSYKFVDEDTNEVFSTAGDVVRAILGDEWYKWDDKCVHTKDILLYEAGSTHGSILTVKLPSGGRVRIPYRII
jgi:hypothetical protein